METGLSRAQILNKLNLSLHGDLDAYVPVFSQACSSDPEFLAHLIAWDFVNGQIKDTKLALPVITAASVDFPEELVENSLAHLAMQAPREVLKALRFSIKHGMVARRQRALERMIRRYLEFKEAEPGRWMRMAARHRLSLRELYARTHAKRPAWVGVALFRGEKGQPKVSYPVGSIFADIANLKNMDAAGAAAAIQKWHLSPMVVGAAMTGSRAKQDDAAVVSASMAQMSDTELVTRAVSLERRGVGKNAALKEGFRKKVAAAQTSKKATLKTSVAADEVEDIGLATMLRELQERQIEAQKNAGRGIDGNWLVICDRSQSQEVAIELGVQVAAVIAKFVTGRVYLVFCNQEATPMDVTGKTLEDIRGQAKFMFASGGTSYGIGLQWALEKGHLLDGVAIIGDGGENSHPVYAAEHVEYKRKFDKALPTYFYQTACPAQYSRPGSDGDPRLFKMMMDRAAIQFTQFDFTSGKVDYYSLPNVCMSMNASRFGVVEKIMASPLLTLDQVLPSRVTA